MSTAAPRPDAEVEQADAALGYPSIVQRIDLRGAANLVRIVGHYAPTLNDRERDECERIATWLIEMATQREAPQKSPLQEHLEEIAGPLSDYIYGGQ